MPLLAKIALLVLLIVMQHIAVRIHIFIISITFSSGVCGDGKCDSTENCTSCYQDCGLCSKFGIYSLSVANIIVGTKQCGGTPPCSGNGTCDQHAGVCSCFGDYSGPNCDGKLSLLIYVRLQFDVVFTKPITITLPANSTGGSGSPPGAVISPSQGVSFSISIKNIQGMHILRTPAFVNNY